MNNRVSGTDIIGTIVGVVLFLLIASVFVGDDEPDCIKDGCDSSRVSGSSYCYVHKPASWSSNYKSSYNGSSYSGSSTSSSTKKTTTSTTKKPTSSSSKKPSYTYYDPYDVYDYDNGDDFADEWAEEFGDGDWEDGYDDAYNYWEDEMGY